MKQTEEQKRAKKKSSLTKSYDSIPLVVRLILQFFLGWIISGIYRILRYLEKKNTVTLVVGIISCFTGGLFGILWVLDFITLILSNKPTVLAK